ncbi:MAG TPA: aspartate/glutamate racemase family protein [Bacillales bacterium]|nr:aspartate/glutamate racemase family protein [Bacillales bacterium]
MTKTLAVIHTTPVTVAPLKSLAAEFLPGYEVINFVDDSILPRLGRNGGKVEEVEDRLIQYGKYAEESGADVILNACSSVGEVVAKAEKALNVPIVRIDEAMAEEAINRGKRIGVIATLSTTLNPTLRLLQGKAKEFGKNVEIEPVLAEEAYRQLMAGDPDGHDSLLADKLRELAEQMDVVVLAQASMARAVKKLPEEEQGKFLTSPELGMERVQRVAEGLGE